MANRISLRELSELLAKEVQNGNGDAFVFVGEYYVVKDNYTEVISGLVANTTKEYESPYIIYNDGVTKEKIMAINYQHVQKLTDEENAELEKRLKEDDEKKYYKAKKSSAPRGYTIDANQYYAGGFGNARVEAQDEAEQPVIRDGVVRGEVRNEQPVDVERAARVTRDALREYTERLANRR